MQQIGELDDDIVLFSKSQHTGGDGTPSELHSETV